MTTAEQVSQEDRKMTESIRSYRNTAAGHRVFLAQDRANRSRRLAELVEGLR